MLNFMTCAIFSLPFRIHLRDLLSGSVCCCWSEQIWWPFYMCGIVMNKWRSPNHLEVTYNLRRFKFSLWRLGFTPFLPIFTTINCQNDVLFIFVSSWPNINKIFSFLVCAQPAQLCSAQFSCWVHRQHRERVVYDRQPQLFTYVTNQRFVRCSRD